MDFLAECPTDLKLRFGQDEETLSDFANVRTLDRYGAIGASAQILFNGVNENALMLLFRRKGIEAKQQALITVYFEEEVVGNYYADILVEDKVILEIKPARHPAGGSVEKIIDAHIAQTLNYLKATGLRLAIILNFSKEKLEYKRIIK